MTNIKELLEKINEKTAEANIDLNEINPRSRAGVEGLVRAARRDLPELERAYTTEVIRNTKILAVNGEKQSELATMAEKAGIMTIDYDAATKEITEAIRSRLAPGKEDDSIFESNVNFLMIDELRKFQLKYEISALPEPIKHDKMAVLGKNYKEAVRIILDVNYGDQLRSAVTRVLISRNSLAKKIETDIIPVILFNYTGNVDTQYLPAPTLSVEVGADTTSEQLESIAAEFASSISPKQTKGQSARKTKEKKS